MLQIATRNAARFSGLASERGRIATAFVADLALVDGDPTADITAPRRMVTVATQGEHIDPTAVYQEVGIKPFLDAGPRWVETGLATPSGASGGR